MNRRFKLHCIALLAGCLALTFVSGCSQFGNIRSQNSDASASSKEVRKTPTRVYSTRTAPKSTAGRVYTEENEYDGPLDASILAEGYPNNYTVVRGDTLWDISAHFLRDPWLWPVVWQENDQIANPHLIYPGDVITLVWLDGKPALRLGEGTLRLSPKVRYEDLGQAIPTIPYDAISSFLSKPTVIDRSVADRLPYILASADGRLVMSEGERVYGRGNIADPQAKLNLMHIGDPYVDPETNYTYGYEALNIGEAQVIAYGDPFTLRLIDTDREVLRGDRLMPIDDRDGPQTYYPHSAPADLDGSIISVVNGLQYIGPNNIVVINRGANAGLEDGSVISIYQSGDTVYDPFTTQQVATDQEGLMQRLKGSVGSNQGKVVKLPDEYAGIAMVFRTFDSLSYALVMGAEREIHEGDSIGPPQ